MDKRWCEATWWPTGQTGRQTELVSIGESGDQDFGLWMVRMVTAHGGLRFDQMSQMEVDERNLKADRHFG